MDYASYQTRDKLRTMNKALTLLSALIAGFAALPFSFAGRAIPYVDGYFEAMSGLTTTGSTVLLRFFRIRWAYGLLFFGKTHRINRNKVARMVPFLKDQQPSTF